MLMPLFLTPKQESLILHNSGALREYLPHEHVDLLIKLAKKPWNIFDANETVGLVWDVAVKDKREGMTDAMKKIRAAKLKRMIIEQGRKFHMVCYECDEPGDFGGGYCPACMQTKNDGHRSVECLKESTDQ